ncbi:chromosome segregation protein SMC [Desulfurobacterium sp. TC5-1]|uniref:chromosome segregation protein SMC n=1 Tax=Desulfurobacterium sp. TC5-1 TaxID=1158318 RepID=UPI0003B6F157|nr:chromosome segregation protein SMC [Desulfurobacterium sp. TC5-1]
MHIKSLNLKGFKSFADETEIRFSRGINCIVGPNGCGKSNIVDALKWVTGDTSSKGMRASNMKDMVFKGAVGRRAARTAEVSITLYRDELLPIKENEITITRKIKSNGDSEFLINNRKVRLKDIQEFFASIGLGHKDYAFFEQGQIDRILKLKPEDRRGLIDDAAGVGPFKEKKEETLKKLEDAETNLENVRKVINEVGRNLKTLKNQAEKAKRYEVLKQKEREFEKKLLGFEIRGIRIKKEFTEKELAVLREDRVSLEKELSTLQVGLENLRKEVESVTKEIEETSKELYELEKTKKESSVRREFLGKEIKRTESELKELDSEELLKIERLKKIKEETESLVAERKKLKKKVSSLEEAVSFKRQQLKDFEADKKALEEEISKIRRFISEAVSRYSKIEMEMVREEEKVRSYSRQIEKLPSEIESCEKEKKYYLEQKNRLEKRLSSVLREIETLKEEKKKLLLLKDKKEEKVSEVKRAIQEKEKEIVSVSSKIESMEKLLETLDFGKLENSIVESGKHGKVKGYIGLLINLIKVDEGWERIVESYLSTFGAGIVVKTFDDIIWIKERIKGNGRVLLFAADVTPVKNKYIEDATPLISHVKPIDTRVKDLVSVVFSNVFFTSSDAEKLAKEHPDCIFVDKELNLYSGKGSFIGKFKARGILEIEKEIENLKKRKTVLEQELEEINKKLSPAWEELSEVEESISEINIKSESLRVEKVEIEGKLREVENRIEVLSSDIESLKGRLKTAREAVVSFSSKNELYEKKLSELSSKKVALEKQLTEKEKKLKEVEKGIETFKESLSALQSDLSLYREKLRNLEEKLTGKERAVKAIKDEIKTITEKRERLLSELEKARKGIEEAERILSGIDEAIEDTKNDLKALEERRNELSVIIKQKEEALKQKESELKALQKKIKEYEIELAKLNVKEEEIVQKILEIESTVTEAIEAAADVDNEEELKRELISVKEKISRLGAVNLLAIEEYNKVKERYEFILEQEEDLIKSIKDLKEAIEKIDEEINRRFFATFKAVNKEFRKTFKKVFGGGSARLVLTSDDPAEAGIEIEAKPPGKKHSNINLLSGGERTLVVISLLYALYSIHPAPFLVLDEIDAALDEINILRFTELLKTISEKTQVIVITHKKVTMEVADVLYGVTMEIPGISKIVGVSFAVSEAV